MLNFTLCHEEREVQKCAVFLLEKSQKLTTLLIHLLQNKRHENIFPEQKFHGLKWFKRFEVFQWLVISSQALSTASAWPNKL
jgi:hypothetical protein